MQESQLGQQKGDHSLAISNKLLNLSLINKGNSWVNSNKSYSWASSDMFHRTYMCQCQRKLQVEWQLSQQQRELQPHRQQQQLLLCPENQSYIWLTTIKAKVEKQHLLLILYILNT
jgi:hypothetical protein